MGAHVVEVSTEVSPAAGGPAPDAESTAVLAAWFAPTFEIFDLGAEAGYVPRHRG